MSLEAQRIQAEEKRAAFIDAFVVQFLATWAAQQYENACATGDHDIFSRAPSGDARVIAEMVYEEIEECLNR